MRQPAAISGETIRPVFYGWRVVAVLWLLLFVNLGFTTYGSGILNTAMAESMLFDGRSLGLSFSAFLLFLGLPAPLVAWCIGRLGLRSVILIGTALVFTGALSMATIVKTPIGSALAFGVILGSGVAFGGTLVGQVAIGRWFVRRRALALSIMFSANGVGGLVAAPLLNHAVEEMGGWRSGWQILAASSLVVGVIAAIVMRESPAQLGQAPDGDPAGVALPAARVHITNHQFTAGQAIRTFSFWMIGVASITNCAALSLVLSHGVASLRSLGHSSYEAALGVSLLSASTLVGKMLLGAMGDRVEPRKLWMWASLLMVGGLSAMPYASSTVGLVAYAIMFGLGFGGAIVLQSAVLLNHFGVKAFAPLIALILLLQTLVGALVPVAAGHFETILGGYTLVFWATALLAAIAVPALGFAKPSRAPDSVGGASPALSEA